MSAAYHPTSGAAGAEAWHKQAHVCERNGAATFATHARTDIADEERACEQQHAAHAQDGLRPHRHGLVVAGFAQPLYRYRQARRERKGWQRRWRWAFRRADVGCGHLRRTVTELQVMAKREG